MGQQDQFAPPGPSGCFVFSEETFAGGCGNEKDGPQRPFTLLDARFGDVFEAFDFTGLPPAARPAHARACASGLPKAVCAAQEALPATRRLPLRPAARLR